MRSCRDVAMVAMFSAPPVSVTRPHAPLCVFFACSSKYCDHCDITTPVRTSKHTAWPGTGPSGGVVVTGGDMRGIPLGRCGVA